MNSTFHLLSPSWWLFARSFLAVLLVYLLQSAVLLIADEQDDLAKLSSLDKQVTELYQAGKFNEAIPIAQEFLELSEKALGPDQPQTAGALNDLAVLYKTIGNYAKAEPLYQRALKIYEKALGPDQPQTALALRNLGDFYTAMGDYAKAEPLCQRALKISEKALGPDHPQTAGALKNLGDVYGAMGDYAKAEPLYQRALKICEKALGPDDPQTAGGLNNLAVLYQAIGNYAKAEPLYQRALKIDEKALGPDHANTATALSNLGNVYSAMGDYAKAEPLYQRALKIREKALGPDHVNTAAALSDLGGFYSAMGDYPKVEPLYQRALKIREKALGPDHPDTATSLNNLAWLYQTMYDYAKAEPLYQRALKIREKALGPDHPDTATSLNNLAWLYQTMYDYTKAEPLYQRALKIREKALGPDHPDTATSLNNLATLYKAMYDYAKAEPLYQRALKIREKALGPDHPDTATSLNNLATLYDSMYDYAKAEPLYQRALKIREKALGPDHPATATSLNNLATLYKAMGDYAKAEPLYQRSLKIREKTLGPDHPQTARALNDLGELYYDMANAKAEPVDQLKMDEKEFDPAQTLSNLLQLYSKAMGDYAKAEPFLQRALKIDEKALGPDHPQTAQAINNLALLYQSTAEYAKAEPLYQRALKIREKALGPNHPQTAQALNNLAWLYQNMYDYANAEPLYQRALKIYEKALGREHRSVAPTLTNLALLKIDLDEAKDAAPLIMRAREVEEKCLSNILSFASEQQRLAFQKTTNPYSLLATLGSATELAQTVLRQKGVVLDSLLEDRLVAETSSDPKQREIIEQLRVSKERLMQLDLEVPKDLSEEAQKKRAAEKEKLSTEVEQLEAGLARQVAGLGKARHALGVTVKQVQTVLPKQAVLVELLRYNRYVGKGSFERHYGAVLIPAMGDPKWVQLGVASKIEKAVELYRRSVRQKRDDTPSKSVLQALEERVWAPIGNNLPAETQTIIISPDGDLSFVSFATLVGPDDKFVGEKYSVRYVASGRDLLRESKPSGNSTTVVFADPDFESQTISRSAILSAGALRSLETKDAQKIPLPALPGTREEANEFEKHAGKSAKIFLGRNASEGELRRMASPRVLYLATHGFFLPELELGKQINPLQPQSGEAPKTKLENPMHRSGLALAGAQSTLSAWSRGEVPPVENDGIVTAEEVGGLKLDGTWLVVLSACDTGSGEARAGEGVMGLRRGFIQAGAQNIVLTLWAINDQITVKIMADFYEMADSTHNAPKALAEVQRNWLIKLRREQGLATAVKRAGPFIMNSQGKPQ